MRPIMTIVRQGKNLIAKRKEDMRQTVIKSLDDACDMYIEDTSEAIAQKFYDKGTTLKSVYGRRVSDTRAEVGNAAPQSVWGEFGTRPHMPPVDALMEWVLRKKISRDEREARSIAWAIAKDIEKHGTLARPFHRPALHRIEARFPDIIKVNWGDRSAGQ